MSTDEAAVRDGDNLIARKAQIKGKIDSIHMRKRLIVEKLREFHENGFDNDELKGKLVEAYDQLDSQEKEYMQLFVDITRIHEQATEDFTNEMLETVDRLLEVSLEGGVAENDDSEELMNGLNDEIARLQRDLLDNRSRALKATMVHEQLIEQLSQEKTKQAYFNEYHKTSGHDSKTKSQQAQQDVQAMRIRVHGEKHENDRKQKQLERLRRKAVEKGIMAGKEEEEQKKALVAQVDEKKRVPAFESEEKEIEGSEEVIEKTDEQLQEARRKEIRERLKQQREERDQYSSIRERFKAMEERKKRMENIREMLAKMQAIQTSTSTTEAPVPDEAEEDPVKFLEDTYTNAQAKLRELTTMRENLESIRELSHQVHPAPQSSTEGSEDADDSKNSKTEQNTVKEAQHS